MKKALISFVFGVLAGGGGYWFYDTHRAEALQAQQKVMSTAEAAAQSLKEKLGEINPDAVKEQVARSGVYVVEKVKQAGAAVADATTDARITTAIKAKLVGEPGLASLKLSVDTTDGVVTLAGTAKTHEEVARAVRVAMGTEGVRKVISTIQVKPAS